MKCECAKCNRKVTHKKVIIAGIENNYCASHFRYMQDQFKFVFKDKNSNIL